MIIYGLGNNEPKYLTTRHNVGRIVLEKIIPDSQLTNKQTFMFAKNGQFHYLLSRGYMNNSGLPLADYVKYFKLLDQTLLILQDDSDQVEGNVKVVQGGGSGGHNGISSIYQHLLSTNIDISNVWRIKIGIRPPNNTQKSGEFVLKNNSTELTSKLNTLAVDLKKLVESGDMINLQQTINTKN